MQRRHWDLYTLGSIELTPFEAVKRFVVHTFRSVQLKEMFVLRCSVVNDYCLHLVSLVIITITNISRAPFVTRAHSANELLVESQSNLSTENQFIPVLYIHIPRSHCVTTGRQQKLVVFLSVFWYWPST